MSCLEKILYAKDFVTHLYIEYYWKEGIKLQRPNQSPSTPSLILHKGYLIEFQNLRYFTGL